MPSGGGEGTIVTYGGRFGGYALYLSRTFNWWYRASCFRRIGLVLAVIGLLFVALGAQAAVGEVRHALQLWLAIAGAGWWVSCVVVECSGSGAENRCSCTTSWTWNAPKWEGPSLGAGKHTIVFDFKYDGPGLAKGGTGMLSVDGKEVARQTMEHTIPIMMSNGETLDIGLDTRTPVDDNEYHVPFAFTGTIDKVTYKLGPDQMSAEDKKTVATSGAGRHQQLTATACVVVDV